MYHSDWLIQKMQADKLMALQLDKALAGVRDQVLENAARIEDGATQLSYYLSCFTDNYQDVCARLKHEDERFIKGLYQLIKERNIIFTMIQIYIDYLLQDKTLEQLQSLKLALAKENVNIATGVLTNQALTFSITTTICLNFNLKLNGVFINKAREYVHPIVIAAGFYGYVQKAADSAARLQAMSPMYHYALYIKNLEMMYFLVEPLFIKANVFIIKSLTEKDIANIIINMVR